MDRGAKRARPSAGAAWTDALFERMRDRPNSAVTRVT